MKHEEVQRAVDFLTCLSILACVMKMRNVKFSFLASNV